MNNYFNTPNHIVTSDRVLYTPSDFAKKSLCYLQEIGTLKANQPHISKRSNLASYLFFIVQDGSGELKYCGNTYELRKGDCVFIDCLKSYAHSTNRELWSLSWVHFNGNMIPDIYDKYLERGGKPVFNPRNFKLFVILFEYLFSTATSDDYIRDMKINSELNQLLELLMAETTHSEGNGNLKKNNLQSIKEYLDTNYSSQINLDELSAQFFISKYYLTREFKKQYGISINAYLQNVRITHAKQMLRFTNNKVETIGLECGLGAANYFSRTFKKVEGISPSEYRKLW